MLGIIFVLMPLVYIHIINTLHRQKQIYEATAQENVMRL